MISPASDSPAPLETESLDARLAQMVDGWKRRLLDLTRRNRALNFKPTRVSTVAIVDEQPVEIFRHLVLQERAMKFRAQPPTATKDGEIPEPPIPTQAADDEVDVEDIDGAGVDFVPYEAASLDERHRDDWLQTSATPEVLDKSLRRIDELARSTIEEQGVNTLYLTLGMLYYKESSDAEETNKAPLIMVPVALTRKSARSGYSLTAGDEDPLANPALGELLRRQFGIQLPDFPSSDALKEDYDLQVYLAEVSERVKNQSGWSVTNDVFLASFSFQKLVMYKDLESHHDPAVRHRLVQQLATREGSEVIGLPEEIRRLDLDQHFSPETTHQVVDADSSQLRAIAAVARQHDLVIEGPPGTGKSQTITNLIATALSAGKSVLFVAEKQAALSVVHSRLVAAGLGEFCLELHSNKAKKRAVLHQISDALDASLQTLAHPTGAMERLPRVRAELTAYARAVHAPYGDLGWSPYRAYGEFSRLLDAPRCAFSGSIGGITPSVLEETTRHLETLSKRAAEIGNPAEHPWRDTTRAAYLPTDLEEIDDSGRRLVDQLTTLIADSELAAREFGFPRISSQKEINHALVTGAVLARSPGAPRHVLESEAWNQPPPDALDLVREGRQLLQLRTQVLGLFHDAVLNQNHADDVSFMLEKLGSSFSFLAFLSGRYRATKKKWMGYRLVSYARSLVEQADDLKLVDRYCAAREALASRVALGLNLFGPLWRGEDSDWNALDGYIAWVTEFRQTCLRHHVDLGRAAELTAHGGPDLNRLHELGAKAKLAQSALESFAATVGWPSNYFEGAEFTIPQGRVRALVEQLHRGPAWAAFHDALINVQGSVAGEFVLSAQKGELPFADLNRAFRRAFLAKWLAACLRERPLLERFQTMSHEERLSEFRQLDERVLRDNRVRLVGQLRDTVQHKLKQPDAVAAMGTLRRELVRQRGHQPLRRTLRESEAAVRAIKPCFMMSPLTVAQYLEGKQPTFDVVIFDEASQLPSEDAAGAIIRGRQLVVVGDPKQLPPTAFFAGQQAPTYAEDGTPLAPDAESVLEEFMGAGMPMSRLKWHYRSAHESLIAFSNVSFYDAQLFTFPSVETGAARGGLQFELVEGVYEGKGINSIEAKRVADAVVEFAKLQAERRSSGQPTQSLGVGTFNLRQQLAIIDELEVRRRNDPSLEPFFDRTNPEPFFVKNLENIQGDERDVIYISVTYAKASDGKLRYNFGPINGDNGWRRLNVLVTRARHCMRVFSSMRGEEINAAATTSGGAKLLREFLIYAERGRLDSAIESVGAATESPFERDVAQELSLRGHRLLPQVGIAGYRIDLGVVDDQFPGRFLCGIECDGAAYHSSETARDRDRLRQQVLEARGWTIYRVWSTSWFLDRKGQIERLCQLIQQTRERLTQERDAEKQAREHAAASLALKIAEDASRAQREAAEAKRVAEIPYRRPTLEPYVLTPFDDSVERGDILSVPLSQLTTAAVTVVEVEGPIHMSELCLRLAQAWKTKAGAKISRRIEQAAAAAEHSGQLMRRGDFWWRPDFSCPLRSRVEVRTPADRIAPEEYAGIIRRILGEGHGFSREELVVEVRGVLGFSRTGALLDEAIRSVIDSMVAANELGEGSTGVRLRR